ncbi:structural maintenance of chromosomes protein [Nephila pilipes]|uniref:Structural maintenance of chromosomes protein n=1 Tax=Nephila pilipes TaxID=299642 RepID=A0A8X6PNC5_NEPPI|nr:structural maintenance of chromosomes protein [Nephila pilipes]
MDCFTFQADQVFHKSALTGDYFDTRKLNLDILKAHVQLLTEINEQERQLIKHGKTLTNIENKNNQIVSGVQKSKTIKNKNQDMSDKLTADIRLMKEGETALGRSHEPKERSLISIDSSLKSMQTTERFWSSEFQQNSLSQLSITDQQEIN